ncbi:MAG: DUF3658 domain-containing protein [Acidovorax sp.]|jgi:hypothetical protein
MKALTLSLVHLVAGDSAAGCLRAACASYGMPGVVIGYPADLAHGPLDDVEASVAYMQLIAKGYGESETEHGNPFAQWRAVDERLARERPDAIIIWTGDNVADATFIAMVCDRLAARSEPLWRVQVPAIGSRPHVAMHSPEQLAQLFDTRAMLSDGDRQCFAQDFARIRDTSGRLRRLEGGRVVDVPIEYYDLWLLAGCGTDWQPAARVVGMAMASCDGPNLMGDAFFTARLTALIEAGSIETSGTRPRVLDCSVRLATR